LPQLHGTQAWLRLPVVYVDGSDPWTDWHCVREVCEGGHQLLVALELTANLPDDANLDRWIGEPVKTLILSPSVWLTNPKGYPVLSKRHQGFIHKMMVRTRYVTLISVKKSSQFCRGAAGGFGRNPRPIP
jgi:protein arginine N-methyltransferase 5